VVDELGYDPDRPDVWTWMQAWFVGRCDGVWEHAHGVTITTLDNPGWEVNIDLSGSGLDQIPYVRHEVHRSEDDRCVTWVASDTFRGACGPTNLAEALHQFREWVTASHT
jgi:hypothetical protein